MKKFIIAVCLLTVGSVAMADTYVNGYYRQDGTYVKPHYRSNADGYTFNNYSTRGNVNPYTGQQGYRTYNYNSYGNSYGNSYNNNYNRYRYGY